jgi:uncharacterized protein YjiS (DUF1127 family)
MLTSLGNILHDLTAALAERRRIRRAYDELSALDDRSLADIGISRSEIAYVLTHSTEPHGPTAPATAADRTTADSKFRHAA